MPRFTKTLGAKECEKLARSIGTEMAVSVRFNHYSFAYHAPKQMLICDQLSGHATQPSDQTEQIFNHFIKAMVENRLKLQNISVTGAPANDTALLQNLQPREHPDLNSKTDELTGYLVSHHQLGEKTAHAVTNQVIAITHAACDKMIGRPVRVGL